MILIMPFNRTATAVAVIVAMLVAGLLALRITSAGRLARRSKSPLPGPAAAPTAVQEPGPGVAAFDPEEELKALHGSISGGSDRREAIQSIYLAARRMLLDRDPALPGSATHRELYHRLTGSRPSLSEPLAVITNSYEDAVFGHFPPTDEEINSSLYSLNEMKRLLYGDGGIGQ